MPDLALYILALTFFVISLIWIIYKFRYTSHFWDRVGLIVLIIGEFVGMIFITIVTFFPWLIK